MNIMLRKSYILLAIGLIAVVACLVTFFVIRRTDSYACALPASTNALVRMDVPTLLQHGSVSPNDLYPLSGVCDEASVSQWLNASKPVYAFVDDANNIGLLCALTDAGALEQALQRLADAGRASSVERQRSLQWCCVEQRWLLCFDSRRLLVMGPAVGSEQDALRQNMAKLMEQSRDDSGLATDIHERLASADAPVAASLSTSLLSSFLQGSMAQQLGLQDLLSERLEISLDASANALVAQFDIPLAGDVAQRRMQTISGLLHPVTGVLAGDAPADAALWLTLNLRGTDVLTYLRSFPVVRTALVAANTVVDVDAMLRAVDGDVAVSTSADGAGWMLSAQLHDADFLKQADYWLSSPPLLSLMRLRRVAPQHFAIDTHSGETYYFGVRDGVLYVTNTSSTVAAPAQSGPNAHVNSAALAGTRVFATLDVDALMRMLGTAGGIVPGSVTDNISHVDLCLPAEGAMELRLQGRDGRNLLQALLQAMKNEP